MRSDSTSVPDLDPALVSTDTVALSGEIRLRTMPAAHCAALAGALDGARPADLDAREAAALARVTAAAAVIQIGRTEEEKRAATTVRPAAEAFGNAWAGVAEVLIGLARLPTRAGADARVLAALLFSEGVRFVKRDASAAWAEGQRRLDLLESEGKSATLAALIGAESLAHLQAVTDALSAATTAHIRSRASARPGAIRDAVAQFARAVAAYVRVLAGKLDDESPATHERFAHATAPLARYRSSRKRNSR